MKAKICTAVAGLILAWYALHETTLNVSEKLFSSMLRLSNFAYFNINHKSWFSRFTADYTLKTRYI